MTDAPDNIGVVTIGRNEGQRLVRCLDSIVAHFPRDTPIVYVDSGSTDGSVEAAEARGVTVLQLDMAVPFTMARGRNKGFRHLIEQHPDITFVQFIDGDCELLPDFVDAALETLRSDDKIAVVCGRRKERQPETSIYNRLADMEWNTPVGQAKACGGDALMRVVAIEQVNGYDPALICGEEPEMCVRLRQKGWKIHRIDCDMTLHDAAMTKFSQWWKRSVRGGWAYAEGSAMHGAPPERHNVRESRSVWIWGLGLPILALAAAWPTHGLSALLLMGYPLLAWRVYRYRRSFGDRARDCRMYAAFCVIGKFPQAIGQIKYWLNRMRGRQATLIEYKGPDQAAEKSKEQGKELERGSTAQQRAATP